MTNSTPLTTLSEEEKLFRDEITKFAQSKIKPLVMEMDKNESMDPGIIKGLFEMGLMGVEIPDQYGGAGGSFFLAILAVEELARVDPSVGVLVDVQNTLVNNIFMRWGNEEQKKKYFPQLASSKVGSYCLTEPNSGSDALRAYHF